MQRLIQRLLRKLTILGQYEESLLTSSTPSTSSSSSAGDKSSALKAKQHVRREECILNVCDDPFILAQQLTHIEMVSEGKRELHYPSASRGDETDTRASIMGWQANVSLILTH